jgi:hypothetical protein
VGGGQHARHLPDHATCTWLSPQASRTFGRIGAHVGGSLGTAAGNTTIRVPARLPPASLVGHGSLDAEKTIPRSLAAVNWAAIVDVAIACRGDLSDRAWSRGWFLAEKTPAGRPVPIKVEPTSTRAKPCRLPWIPCGDPCGTGSMCSESHRACVDAGIDRPGRPPGGFARVWIAWRRPWDCVFLD